MGVENIEAIPRVAFDRAGFVKAPMIFHHPIIRAAVRVPIQVSSRPSGSCVVPIFIRPNRFDDAT